MLHTTTNERVLVPLSVAARRLATSKATVTRLLDAGELTGARVGARIKVDDASIGLYLARNEYLPTTAEEAATA